MLLEGYVLRIKDSWVNIYTLDSIEIPQTFPKR